MREHSFCRVYLRKCMANVRAQNITEDTIKSSWGYKYIDSPQVEFHINKCLQVPDGFFWHGRGCCRWIARADGWNAFLEKRETLT